MLCAKRTSYCITLSSGRYSPYSVTFLSSCRSRVGDPHTSISTSSGRSICKNPIKNLNSRLFSFSHTQTHPRPYELTICISPSFSPKWTRSCFSNTRARCLPHRDSNTIPMKVPTNCHFPIWNSSDWAPSSPPQSSLRFKLNNDYLMNQFPCEPCTTLAFNMRLILGSKAGI